MDPGAPSTLIKRLCCHLCESSRERIVEQYQLAVSLLNETRLTEPFPDSSSVCDSIKRCLVHEKRLHDAARFSFLFSKLQRSSVLKNKAQVLHLLLCLRQQGTLDLKSENAAVAELPLDMPIGIPNGHGPFRVPSLHSYNSKTNSESCTLFNGGSQNSGSVERSERDPSGRVARLAAMYGDNGKSLLDGKALHSSSKSSMPRSSSQPSFKTGSRKEWNTYTDVPRDALIREVLFSLQGIEGNFIKSDVAKDCLKIDPKVRLTTGERSMIMKLVEIGWLYSKVKRFCDTHGRNIGGGSVGQSSQDTRLMGTLVNSAGLVNQSLVLAIKEELNEYCRLIAVLESQMNETGILDNTLGEGTVGLTLRRLLMWTLEPRDRLHTLAFISHSVKDVKGGASISSLYQHLQHGDEEHVSVVRGVLWKACRPLFVMLTEWLLDGRLQDPHQEFFVSADPTVSDDRLWHHKYDIRWSMLPSFLDQKLAKKILATGKSLNFLRHVCDFKSPVAGREAIKSALLKTTVESLFNPNECNQLSDLVNMTFRYASSHVLEEILTRYMLVDHLAAIRRYLLLGQGDFIHSLMGLLGPELNKRAELLHSHNLSYLLDSAIGASNAQFEDPDILKRLDVRLLESSPGETGWDVFSLDYHVDGPIGTVFTPDCMCQYLMLFNSLWRAKRMETILTGTWTHRSATSKLCRSLPELKDTLHRIQLLLTEMNHLLCQMAYYMTFEVLECSWHDLKNQLVSAQSLDDVIDAHSNFLKKIIAGALLDEASRDVLTQLRTLYDLMVRLESLQERLYNAVVSEVTARHAAQILIDERTAAGHFGTSTEVELEEEQRRSEFSRTFVPSFQTDLKILSQTYQDMVQTFLLMLAEHDDENLQLLSTRLDFNEHYLRKDHRLNSRLTFLHKRKSMMGTSFCLEK